MASILCCTSGNQTVEAVVQPAWDNHFAAFGGQDVSKVLLDYCEESKIIVYNWHDDTETVYNGMAGACVEIKILRRVVLNRRVVLHAIDATPTRWRGDAGSSTLDRARTAAPSPRSGLVHPTHWLISTQTCA